MRTRVRLIWFLGAALLSVACDCPPSVITAPTATPPPGVAPPPVPIASAVCSSATPVLRVWSGERVNETWKNQFVVTALEATDQTYVVEYRNRLEIALHNFTMAGTVVERHDIGDGAFLARVRLACSAVWSAEVEFTNGCIFGCGPQVPPPPLPPVPKCTDRTGCV